MRDRTANQRIREWLLLLFSASSLLGLLGRSIYLVVLAARPGSSADAGSLPAAVLGALSTTACALLFLPILISTLRRMRGKALRPMRLPPLAAWHVLALGGSWLVAVLAGGLLAGWGDSGWIFASPFLLAGIGLPALLLVWVAGNNLAGGSWRRLWTTLGLGLTGSTIASMLVEYGLIGLAGLLVTQVAAGNPEWQTAVDTIKGQLEQSSDVQSLLTPLAPYLTQPPILLSLLLFAAGLGPLIEESAKSAAVWLVGSRLRSPAEGFFLGALSGAGFALLEGFLSVSGASAMLGAGLAGRAASTLMHITASALLGWGVAGYILERRRGRLLLAFLASTGIHGLWNGSALLAAYGVLRMTAAGLTEPDLISSAAILVGMGTLLSVLAAMLLLLPLANRLLQRSHPDAGPLAASDIMPPPTN